MAETGDLSTHKQTHMSVSLHGQTEFHFNKKDLKDGMKDPKPGKKYKITFTADCTSNDSKDARFRTRGVPKVQPVKETAKADPKRRGTQIEKARGYE